jgi:hypothetical protein
LLFLWLVLLLLLLLVTVLLLLLLLLPLLLRFPLLALPLGFLLPVLFVSLLMTVLPDVRRPLVILLSLALAVAEESDTGCGRLLRIRLC